MLFVCYGAIYGGDAIANKIFGVEYLSAPYSVFSLNLWILCFSYGVSMFLYAAGVLTLIIMPLSFIFPHARKPFSWQGKPSKKFVSLLKWYSKELEKYVLEIENDS